MKKLFTITLLTIATLLPVETALASETYAVTIADKPTWIMAPSINLFSPVEDVGTNERGEMDVPDGTSNSVGWYAGGVKPGEAGTAVLDAHVFAAFRDLDKVKAGDYVYIFMQSGTVLTFQITQSNLYDLSTLSPHALFEPHNTTKKLNLITCAGEFAWDRQTYTHRLIVSAELV